MTRGVGMAVYLSFHTIGKPAESVSSLICIYYQKKGSNNNVGRKKRFLKQVASVIGRKV